MGFLEKLGRALIWTPSDTCSSCTLSPFRLLDHVVISPSFQVLARSMTVTHDLPWHAHLGLEITLSREAKTFQCQELALPRPFVQLMAENRKPDPSSKRAKRKAAFQNRISKSEEQRAAGPTADEDQDPNEPLFRTKPNEARDRIWHTFHSLSDPDETTVPPHVVASQAHAFNSQGSNALGRRWGRWTNAMEKYFWLDLRIPPQRWPEYTGRSLGAQTRSTTWDRCKPPCGLVGSRCKVPPPLPDLRRAESRQPAATGCLRSSPGSLAGRSQHGQHEARTRGAVVLPPLRHLHSQPSSFGACIVKPQTAPNTSVRGTQGRR